MYIINFFCGKYRSKCQFEPKASAHEHISIGLTMDKYKSVMFNANAASCLLRRCTFSSPEFISKEPVPIVVFIDAMGMVNWFWFSFIPQG